MTLETFFEKFDQFADAPDGMTEMRELILLLSVRGKLSEQATAESCDSQLAAASAFAKQKGRAFDRNPTEAPFSIPPNWGWVAVGHAMTLVNGTVFKPEDWTPTGAPIVRIQNLNKENATFNRYDGEIDPKFYVHSGDFLISWSGTPGTSFGAFIWNRGFAILNQHIFRCELADGVFLKEYLRLAVNARLDEMISRAHGAVGLRHITKGKLESIPLPLPPLAEQKRIVAKVDELMALCDRLEAQQQERETRHAALARAALARFADAPTPANLTFLFHPSYTIPPADLRKSILTLAVQGKLVPQDPNDEPPEDSFPGLKPFSQESPNGSHIPSQWALCSYRTLTTLVTSGSRGWKEFYAEKGSIFVRTQNIKTDKLVLDDVAFVDLPKTAEGMRAQVLKDDILVTITGANVTKAARAEEQVPEAYVSQHIALTRPRWSETSQWLHLCFISHGSARGVLEQLAYGDKPGLNLNNIRDLVLPIPPLAEQRRIVAKVEQLMAVVDQLETQLAASRATAANLLEAVVAELTTQKGPTPNPNPRRLTARHVA